MFPINFFDSESIFVYQNIIRFQFDEFINLGSIKLFRQISSYSFSF